MKKQFDLPNWVWIGMFIGLLLLIWNLPAEAQTVSEKQRTRKAQMETFQADETFETLKKGYISAPTQPNANPYAVPQSGYIRLKTRETPKGATTIGYVNGRYVRIKTEKKDG